MQQRYIFSVIVLLLTLCGAPLSAQQAADSAYTPHISHYVKVETNKGDFVLGLYDETPKHRDNFLALVRNHQYDGVIFHRVIARFMVQTGNLQTKGATPSTNVDIDTLSRTVEAEIMPEKLFHKRYALAAARLGDEVNPTKASSGSQFYIVTGNYFLDDELNDMEASRGEPFTPQQREAYKTEGGTPHLDGGYTVFGEVVSGFKTIDKIEEAKTNSHNRPLKDIIIEKAYEVDASQAKGK